MYIKSQFVLFCFALFRFFLHNKETSSCSRKVMAQNLLTDLMLYATETMSVIIKVLGVK